MAKFAEGTKVPVEKTKGEIESLVTRYRATGFIAGWIAGQAVISFEMRGRRVKFILKLPDGNERDIQRTHQNYQRSPGDVQRVLQQRHRELWRAFLLVIKAKLESVESGIRTFEQEFLNDLVTDTGLTIGQMIQPQLDRVTSTGRLPCLLDGPKPLALPAPEIEITES